jgi:putative addiction module CopG family antidote
MMPMPSRNITLTPEQDDFIEQVVKAGDYLNASEAMRDAIRALQQRRAEEAPSSTSSASRSGKASRRSIEATIPNSTMRAWTPI